VVVLVLLDAVLVKPVSGAAHSLPRPGPFCRLWAGRGPRGDGEGERGGGPAKRRQCRAGERCPRWPGGSK
jgi:hypothetical protein